MTIDLIWLVPIYLCGYIFVYALSRGDKRLAILWFFTTLVVVIFLILVFFATLFEDGWKDAKREMFDFCSRAFVSNDSQ